MSFGKEKISVLIVIQSLGVGGREKMVIDLANNLNRQIFQIHLLSFCNDNISERIKLNNDVQFHCLPFHFKQLSGLRSLIFWLKGFTAFMKTLKKIKPDIIHTHLFFQHFLFASAGLKFSGIKCLQFHSVHTYGLYYTEKGFINNIRLRTEKCAVRLNHAYIIAISENVYETCCLHFKKSAAEIRKIYNGVDEKVFDYRLRKTEPRISYGFNEQDVLITYLARMDSGKDHITLLRAWKVIAQSKTGAKLLLAGSGVLQPLLKEFVHANALSNSVFFLNNINHPEKLLAITDIGVFVSLFEGFSVAVIEKMLMKIPVVAADIPMMHGLINDGTNGFLFKPQDDERLAALLLALINDSILRLKTGEQAYETAKYYSLVRMVQQYELFYKYAAKD